MTVKPPRIKTLILLLLMGIFCCADVALSDTTFHVGNEYPFKTIEKALLEAVPGTSIVVHSGIYPWHLRITKSGENGRPIRLVADGEVIIRGEDATQLPYKQWGGENDHADIGMDVRNVSHIEIEGFTVENCGRAIVLNTTESILIRKCIIRNCGYGILWQGDKAYSNHVEDTDISGTAGGGWGITRSCAKNTKDCEIIRISVHDGGGVIRAQDAICCEHAEDVITLGITFIGCKVYNYKGDAFDIGLRNCNYKLINCMAYDNTGPGYKIWGDNVTLINCISHNNVMGFASRGNNTRFLNCLTSGNETYGIECSNRTEVNKHFVMRNTIFINEKNAVYFKRRGTGSITTDIDYCLLSNIDTSDADMGAHTITGDPMFVDIPNKDFSLKTGSPAIDTGDPEDAPPEDITGFKRDGKPDIGPYEFRKKNSAR